MTDKDRHSTWANSKVSNLPSQTWYTPLVEVNQAILACRLDKWLVAEIQIQLTLFRSIHFLNERSFYFKVVKSDKFLLSNHRYFSKQNRVKSIDNSCCYWTFIQSVRKGEGFYQWWLTIIQRYTPLVEVNQAWIAWSLDKLWSRNG